MSDTRKLIAKQMYTHMLVCGGKVVLKFYAPNTKKAQQLARAYVRLIVTTKVTKQVAKLYRIPPTT